MNGKKHGVFSLLPKPMMVLHCVGLVCNVVLAVRFPQRWQDFLHPSCTSKSLHPNFGIEKEMHFFQSSTQDSLVSSVDGDVVAILSVAILFSNGQFDEHLP